ncbi:MAG: SLBB domain-containing protein [Planctomycetota bacterium]
MPGEDSLLLGPGDTIQIYVEGVKDLEQKVTILEEGVFALRPIGTISATGRTAKKIEEEITKRLADGYVKDPKVTVVVLEAASRYVMVIGSVATPGPVKVRSAISMLELLSHAGGLNEASSKEAIIIRRKQQGRPEHEVTRISLTPLLNGDMSKDVALSPDTVVIFPSVEEMTEKVNVLGCVTNPGAFALVKGMRVVDLVAQAGGPNQFAGNLLTIIPSGKREGGQTNGARSFELQTVLAGEQAADIELMPGDTIMVPSSEQLLMNFFIIGHVQKPGMYPWREKMTVLNAISIAGGLTDRGTTNGIQIIKEGGASKQAPLRVDPSHPVERGDTIVIPEGWF